MEVRHRLQPLLPPQERVDGVALDRPRPDDRDLDHEVVEALRARLRERLHLGPALDLEDADGVGRLEHLEHLGDVLGHPVEVEADRAVVLDELERLVHRGQHPEPEQVELDELERLDVALVELDDDPVDHRRPLDRGDVDERRRGDQHPARMDRQVAREAVDPGAELEPALPVATGPRSSRHGPAAAARARSGDRDGGGTWSPARRRRIPAGRAAELVGGALRAARRRLELAALRVDPPAVDERRGDEPVRVRLVAGPPPRPQPGDAGRGVAGATLVVVAATRPDRRRRLGAPSHIPDRDGRCPGSAIASRSQANGRGAFGSSGFGGWRQGGTFPTSGIRVFSWPIPSTKPRPRRPRPRQPRPAVPPPAAGRTRRSRRRPRGRAGP